MRDYYSVMIPRLNGNDVRSRFSRYRALVRKGIAGFIIFGGDLEPVRSAVAELQAEAEIPLIISSDLERGLGQQLRGGTDFPPAMALTSAACRGGIRRRRLSPSRMDLVRRSFRAVADEAKYAGINTIFAPVLDVNTNRLNPIIAVRSFGEDSSTVTGMGREMIRCLQKKGIAACGKHFPGHGDTEVDSHIGLPVIHRSMTGLRRRELRPFRMAVEEGVKMIMLGHLRVPAVDPSGIPLSLSPAAVRMLRRGMGFKGIIITDAMNMGGLGGIAEEEASAMAVTAGVDIILHPTSPEKTASFLAENGIAADPERVNRFRRTLFRFAAEAVPRFAKNRLLSRRLTSMSLTTAGDCRLRGAPFVTVLNDDDTERGRPFLRRLKSRVPGLRAATIIRGGTERMPRARSGTNVVAVFSETRGWKGGASPWLAERLSSMRREADLFVSFGSPYLLDMIGRKPKLIAYSDSDDAQEAAADMISGKQ